MSWTMRLELNGDPHAAHTARTLVRTAARFEGASDREADLLEIAAAGAMLGMRVRDDVRAPNAVSIVTEFDDGWFVVHICGSGQRGPAPSDSRTGDAAHAGARSAGLTNDEASRGGPLLVRRMMDDVEIHTMYDGPRGTVMRLVKWIGRSGRKEGRSRVALSRHRDLARCVGSARRRGWR